MLITLASCALASLLFFTSLDHKFFDIFLRTLPSLTEHEKVIILTLDDDSISYAGGFPFRREVMADVVALLKDLGVDSIAFDLSYLDESPHRLDPVYASQVFGQRLSSGFDLLNQVSDSVIDGIGPATLNDDRERYKQDMLRLHRDVRGDLETSFSLLTRDVDEYFAQSLAFSDCSWLTLTMFRPMDLLDSTQSGTLSNEEIDQYLADHIALSIALDAGDSRTPEMIGVMPAIQKLLSRARGAGVVNAYPDSDGIRRRVQLLVKYNGAYYGNLALMAMIEKLNIVSIEPTNSVITLVLGNGGVIRIPRSPDGSMLLKWPKKPFLDYQVYSLIKLIQHTIIEPAFAQNIALMDDAGFFWFFDEEISPWDYYRNAEELKELAFANNAHASEEWLESRHGFFASCETFLYGPYEDAILLEVGDDVETRDFVQELFQVCRTQYERIAEIRAESVVLQNSLCIIGADATSMTDNSITAFQENYPNVGTYAVVANMMLSREFLSEAPWYVSACIALFFSLFIGFLISRFDTYASILTGVSVLAVLSAASLLFFRVTKIYPGFAVPLTATALSFISLIANNFLFASRERAFLHSAFSRYLAPDIITEIINDPTKLNLGGEKREMTAIFTDLQGFSGISELLDPIQLVRLLNRYLTTMSNIIMENAGTVDKYEGDAIIAFWGAPLTRADHAALACRSALAMKAAERELNKTIVEEGLSPRQLFTRIGINSGDMVVGNMGAENKMDYTIMGNAVNIAARLEGVNKLFSTGILMSEYTHAQIGTEFVCRRLDRVRVVGVNTPIRLYELVCHESEMDEKMKKWLADWDEALDYLENWQFATAYPLFKKLMEQNSGDPVANLYAWRSESYIQDPPPPDWDGVNNLTEK